MEPSRAIDFIIQDFELKNIIEEEKKLTSELLKLQRKGDEKEIQHLLSLKRELIRRRQEFLKNKQ